MKRQIAGLRYNHGYLLLIDHVVKLKRDEALAKLKLARGREEKVDAAYNFCVWDDVIQLLETAPQQYEEELKAEKDEVYG